LKKKEKKHYLKKEVEQNFYFQAKLAYFQENSKVFIICCLDSDCLFELLLLIPFASERQVIFPIEIDLELVFHSSFTQF